MKAQVDLINLKTNDTVGGIYRGEDRYKIVAAAFQDITGKKQHDVMDEWKVLNYQEKTS